MTENGGVIQNIEDLVARSLEKALSYEAYLAMVGQLVLEGRSTGKEQTDSLTNYTLLNERRMKRFNKTVKVNEQQADKISKIDKEITFLVLTESWCGDAAPALPVMHKIAEQNDKIDLKIILRDENLDLMNRFLYNGTLSIPRVLIVDSKTLEVLADWGPRPTKAQKAAEEYKQKHGKLSAEFKEDLQIWYNKDKGQNTLDDLTQLLLENVGNGSLL